MIGVVEGKLRAVSLKPSEELYPRGEANQLSDAANTQHDIDRCHMQLKSAFSNWFTKAVISLVCF